VVILIKIKEMYVKVPKNQLSVTVNKSISADGKAIPSLVIMPGRNIIVSCSVKYNKGGNSNGITFRLYK
jgi:hypothetical protein